MSCGMELQDVALSCLSSRKVLQIWKNHWRDNQEQQRYLHLPYNLPNAGLIETEKKIPKVLYKGGEGHSGGYEVIA